MNRDYTTPHEKLALAVEALTIPVRSQADAVASAMAALVLAFYHDPPPPDARPLIREIEALMAGPGGWEERAARLTEPELRQLAHAFLTLDRLVTRLHHDRMHPVAVDPLAL